jgi:RNA polymerase sigma factor (sigma-70 family)
MSFDQIYNATFKNIYRYFYYKGVNQAEVEDLVHEVYIRFYQKYKDRNLEQVEATKILFGFSRNIYKEWVRKCIKEKRVDLLENYDYFEYEEESISEFADDEYEKRRDLQKSMIMAGLNHLNPKVRSVLELRFLHGMTRKEIAAKLDMKEKDVHTYQKRGIKYLKKKVNN